MSKSNKPPKWWEVYPQGTKAGDEEQRFFKVLERHPTYTWRSTESIGKESGLDLERVEQIINKYLKRGIVFQNPASDDQWGYWERNLDMLIKDSSLAKTDQKSRIDDSLHAGQHPAGIDDVGSVAADKKSNTNAKDVAARFVSPTWLKWNPVEVSRREKTK